MSLLRVLTIVPYNNRLPVQDIIANLHSYFTFNLLIGFSILLSYKQFGGSPIECMTPVGFSSSWTDYTENYCYTADTYFVSLDHAEQLIVNTDEEGRKERRISYYQWIPFFLLFQAACFKLPAIIWKYFHSQSGMKVGEILRLATAELNGDPTTRRENINALCGHLQRVLRFHRRLMQKNIRPHKFFRLLNLKYSAYYVTLIYLLTKGFFFLNVLGQFNLLNRYLFNSTDQLGFNFWKGLLQWNSTIWMDTGVFPRVTWCDFDVREMGQSVNHTVQCILVLNVFMEKAFVVLWFWYSLLAALTLANITAWLYSFISTASSEHFIFNHLEMSGEPLFEDNPGVLPAQIQYSVGRFINKYLRTDGMLILRLIGQHADVVFTTELIYQMWKSHYQIERQREELRKSEPIWRKHLQALERMSARKKLDREEEEVGGEQRTYPKMSRASSRFASLDDGP